MPKIETEVVFGEINWQAVSKSSRNEKKWLHSQITATMRDSEWYSLMIGNSKLGILVRKKGE